MTKLFKEINSTLNDYQFGKIDLINLRKKLKQYIILSEDVNIKKEIHKILNMIENNERINKIKIEVISLYVKLENFKLDNETKSKTKRKKKRIITNCPVCDSENIHTEDTIKICLTCDTMFSGLTTENICIHEFEISPDSFRKICKKCKLELSVSKYYQLTRTRQIKIIKESEEILKSL